MEWISVKDRLPEKYGRESDRVLINTKAGVVSAQYLFDKKVWVDNANKLAWETPIGLRRSDGSVLWCCPPTFYDESMGVTHWMPLPPAPKEDA